LNKRPITQEILAWEMIERNELTTSHEELRESRMLSFFEA